METGRLDIVTLGEAMLRFTPPSPQVLEQAPYFEVRAGGAESNVAITGARMGLQTGWISRLPRSPLGRRVARSVQEHGVDVSRIVWTDSGRVGLYFIDSADAPRSRDTVYDRSGSAITELSSNEVDWDYVASARVLHLTGITLALGDGPREVVEHALELKGPLISFDLNYRAKLWSTEQARIVVEQVLPKVDILCAGLEEWRAVFQLEGDTLQAAHSLHERFAPQVTIVTNGAKKAVAFDGQTYERTPREVKVVDSIGAGDAFLAGFLVGYLERGTEYGLDMGTALGALKLKYLGDIPWCTREDVLAHMQDRVGPSR